MDSEERQHRTDHLEEAVIGLNSSRTFRWQDKPDLFLKSDLFIFKSWMSGDFKSERIQSTSRSILSITNLISFKDIHMCYFVIQMTEFSFCFNICLNFCWCSGVI